MTTTVHAFTTGWLTTDRAGLIEGGEGTARVPVLSFLVDHPQGRLVFDTGLHPEVRSAAEERLGGLASFFATELATGTALDERVAALTDRVDLAVCSHLHFDHCGGNGLLGDVPVLVQRDEWQAAHGGDPGAGYLSVDFDTGQDVRLLDGEHDVFGDGAVVCLPTPGHTAGHQSLRVRTADREVVLTGDACYFRESLETSRLPLFGNDPEQQLRSLDALRRLAAAGAQLVFGHDAEQFPDDAVRTL
jgi:glyoxylase-like metal-dependent hydrolase (beta-lactamase superfamily II)